MNIVIPMAGRGKRFQDAGYKTPKPLIDIEGKPMFVWSVKSLPLEMANNIIFICLAEHLDNWPLEEAIRREYQNRTVTIIPVSEVTCGQACTVLLAKQHIDNEDGLLIHNADTYFTSHLGSILKNLTDDVHGVISVFEADDPKWSFVKIDHRQNVIEVAEKKPISNLATAGMYFFSNGREFVRAAEDMIERNQRINNEFYVGPVYSRLIEKGWRIIIDPVEELWCLGTPEDLNFFLNNYQVKV